MCNTYITKICNFWYTEAFVSIWSLIPGSGRLKLMKSESGIVWSHCIISESYDANRVIVFLVLPYSAENVFLIEHCLIVYIYIYIVSNISDTYGSPQMTAKMSKYFDYFNIDCRCIIGILDGMNQEDIHHFISGGIPMAVCWYAPESHAYPVPKVGIESTNIMHFSATALLSPLAHNGLVFHIYVIYNYSNCNQSAV